MSESVKTSACSYPLNKMGDATCKTASFFMLKSNHSLSTLTKAQLGLNHKLQIAEISSAITNDVVVK